MEGETSAPQAKVRREVRVLPCLAHAGLCFLSARPQGYASLHPWALMPRPYRTENQLVRSWISCWCRQIARWWLEEIGGWPHV
jgi:hypothetical protein